jgi:hypothetical protein
MPTREIRELRLKYKLAYTRYMRSVIVLSDISETPTAPPAHVVTDELGSWEVLAESRAKLLRALRSFYLNREAAGNSRR